MMLRLAILFFVLAASTLANPVVDSEYSLIAENVLIGVNQQGAVVSGIYRFHVNPNAERNWNGHRYPFILHLPVPVLADLKEFDEIEALVHPVVVIKGEKLYPDKRVGHYEVPSLPNKFRMMVFVYGTFRDDIGDEVDVRIQYDQPVLNVSGKQLIYYLPYLPKYEAYRKIMNLDPREFVINCESYGGALLHMAAPVSEILMETPNKIAIRPRHMELISIERLPNQSSDPALSSVTPPAGQEPRPR